MLDKIKEFCKGTKILSRVLFFLWLFIIIVAPNNIPTDAGSIFIIYTLLLLLPAVLIERAKNPVWVKARNEAKIKKLEAKAFAYQQRKEEAQRLQQLKEENKRLRQETDLEMEKTVQEATNNISQEDNIECNSDISLKPPRLDEEDENSHPSGEENPAINRKKKKLPVSHWIWGTIFALLGLAFVIGGIVTPTHSNESNRFILCMLGFMFGSIGALFLTGILATARNKGVYLTAEQIEKLEERIELPVVDTPAFLNYNEIAVYHSRASRQIGKTQYFGDFIITNERIIFLNAQRGFEINHQNLTGATAYRDGFAFQCRKANYSLLLPRPDLATLAFDGVRTGEIPTAEISTSHYYDDHDDDFDDVVSSIDGMEGHKFEHFCANLLEQNGFSDVNVTKGSGDQGVDILATKAGVKYAIQCKNYATPLGNTPIQEVTAGKMFYNCHVGVVMTNSTFTPKAQELAQATGVLLWDREVLQEMIENIDEE